MTKSKVPNDCQIVDLSKGRAPKTNPLEAPWPPGINFRIIKFPDGRWSGQARSGFKFPSYIDVPQLLSDIARN